MSSGKKGKKSKGKTLALTDFLADTPGRIPTIPIKASNWADDVEEDHGYTSRSSKEPVVLPTAPRAARDPGFDEENIPTNPPYVAYISNLPYDVDEDDLVDFFSGMQVSNMRLPKDANKIRGYGYVEFEDRQSLIDALAMTNLTIKTRRMRIEVSNSSNDERRGGRMGRENRRDGYDDPERTSGDWRSGPRDDSGSRDGDRFRGRGGFDRDRRDDREGGGGGGSSEYDNKPGGWREGGDRGGGAAFKERSGFREDEGRDRGEWSRYDRDGDRDRDRGGSGSSFGPRRNYGDSDWERDGPRRQAEEPRTRPKLQLQPRTKPVEPIVVPEEVEESAATVAASDAPADAAPVPAPTRVPAVNIFGAAKPVDTTAREREIEERLAKSNAEARSKEEGEPEKWSAREGAWGRRNGEGRDEKERPKPAWRSEDERGRQMERTAPRSQQASARSGQRGDSKGSPASRGAAPPAPSRGPQRPSEPRGPPNREKKEKDKEDDIGKMPKAKDDEAPNFVAANKYSMLNDDVEPDDIDD